MQQLRPYSLPDVRQVKLTFHFGPSDTDLSTRLAAALTVLAEEAENGLQGPFPRTQFFGDATTVFLEVK